MALTTTQIVLKALHVISATVVVGYFAMVPMWKAAATRKGDPALVKHFLETDRSIQMRVVGPALGVLLLTGLSLVLQPYLTFSIYRLGFVQWAQSAIVLTLILGFLVFASMAGPAKKMVALVEKGESTGPAMEKLWSDWRFAAIAGALLSIVAVAIMVYETKA